MSSFKDLLSRVYVLKEAKASPYVSAHPSFGGVTSKMRASGLSSAPLDTIKFIRETLYFLDIIGDEELNAIKRGAGFTGKKQALLSVLKAKQQEINAKSQEIADRVTSTLDDFINGVGTNRGREEKYAAQAAAQEMASQMRQAKSGKEMDDALTDIVADESLLVKTAVAKILADIQKDLGEPGFDIEEEALAEVINYSSNINSLAALKSFVQQIANEPGYEKIAAYLSSAVKPISQGGEDEEMQEDAEDWEPESLEEYDVNEDEYDAAMSGKEDEEYDATKADIDKSGKVEAWEKGLARKRGFKPTSRVTEGFKTLRSGDLINQLQDVINTPDEKLTDVTNISIRLSDQREIFDRFPKIYPYIKQMFTAVMSEGGAVKTKEIAKQAIEEIQKNYPSADKYQRANPTFTESYTSAYLTEQTRKDSLTHVSESTNQSFKEKYKPKTSYQLEELRRYGL
jgi:hypothetical protein